MRQLGGGGASSLPAGSGLAAPWHGPCAAQPAVTAWIVAGGDGILEGLDFVSAEMDVFVASILSSTQLQTENCDRARTLPSNSRPGLY